MASQPYMQMAISGADELRKVLTRLPDSIEGKVATSALRAGGDVVRDDARASAPRAKAYSNRRGHTKSKKTKGGTATMFVQLHNAIKTSVTQAKKGLYQIAVHNGGAFWALWIEFGRGEVKPDKKQALSDGTVLYGAKSKSVSPHPFFRPAWERSGQKALETIGVELGAGVEKAAEKLAGQFTKSGLIKKKWWK